MNAERLAAARRKAWTLQHGYIAMLVLPCLVLCVFFVWPMLMVLLRSFTDPTLNIDNYVEIFARPAYLRVLWNTLVVAFTVTVLCLLISYPVAAVIAGFKGGLLNLCFALILIPFWTSTVIRTYAWMVLFQRKGVLNGFLQQVGLIDQPLELMRNFIGVQIGMVHVLLPFMILPLLSTLRGIDPVYMRAAGVLGANPVRAFLHVYLPLSMPGISAGVLLVFITALGFFITPALLGSERQMMIAMLIEQQVSVTVNWPLASALSTLLLVVTISIYLVYERLQRRIAAGVLA
ncbi:MAG: ABC transporter permease [Hyphomicrobiaceae bacterium]